MPGEREMTKVTSSGSRNFLSSSRRPGVSAQKAKRAKRIERHMIDPQNADEIFDGQTWYYGIEPGSITVDAETVSFIVRWRQNGKRSQITLKREQVQGVRENLTA
jgi:hypothetical protein